MKRHINLQTLSRQHHNGLLAVLLLRKAVKKNADPKLMKDFINDFFRQDLDGHFMLEEEHLLPLMKKYSQLAAHADKIISEHQLLIGLKEQVNSSADNQNINAFADMLEHHIRYEERMAFPDAEKFLSETELDDIGKILSHHDDKNCMNYPVKFRE